MYCCISVFPCSRVPAAGGAAAVGRAADGRAGGEARLDVGAGRAGGRGVTALGGLRRVAGTNG